jgi:prepilin-type N-terminal cleavage/methylation domain-containing protein
VAAVKPGVRGYSVIELLIALALVTIIILGASQLVAESVVLFSRAGRSVRSPTLTLTMATLRRDVQDSAGLAVAVPLSWTQNPLELMTWDGRRIRINHDGDALVRETYDLLGQPAGRRVLTRGITAWWWRASNPWTFDLRVTATAVTDPVSGGRSSAVHRTETRRFVLRGAPGGRSW